MTKSWVDTPEGVLLNKQRRAALRAENKRKRELKLAQEAKVDAQLRASYAPTKAEPLGALVGRYFG